MEFPEDLREGVNQLKVCYLGLEFLELIDNKIDNTSSGKINIVVEGALSAKIELSTVKLGALLNLWLSALLAE